MKGHTIEGTITIANLAFIGEAHVVVALCPKCDKTHLQIMMPGIGHILLNMEPEEAEALAKDLINPQAAPEGQVKTLEGPQ
jgi:thiamine biosynthesis protein ThiC